MVRTQIQLTESQARELRRMSERRGISVAALIRELVDRELVSPRAALNARARAVMGTFSSGKTHIARDHDAELEQIYLAH
ncbi:MAG TPA: ribbon-helix-helix protein, CopG family [Gaiellaceae bacterium]|jgi:hypothetical protein